MPFKQSNASQRWWRRISASSAAPVKDTVVPPSVVTVTQQSTVLEQQHDFSPATYITDNDISRIISEKQEQLRRIREERARLEAKLKSNEDTAAMAALADLKTPSSQPVQPQPAPQSIASTTPMQLPPDMSANTQYKIAALAMEDAPLNSQPVSFKQPTSAPTEASSSMKTSDQPVSGFKKPGTSMLLSAGAQRAAASTATSGFKKILSAPANAPAATTKPQTSIVANLASSRQPKLPPQQLQDAAKQAGSNIPRFTRTPSVLAAKSLQPISNVAQARTIGQVAADDIAERERDRMTRLNTVRNSAHLVQLVVAEPQTEEELMMLFNQQRDKYSKFTAKEPENGKIAWHPILANDSSLESSPRKAALSTPSRGIIRQPEQRSYDSSHAVSSPVVILPSKARLLQLTSQMY